LESRLKANGVEKTPGVCGGHARIRGTRIPVWTLVSFRQQGADETELLQNYPSLTAQNLSMAWDYYEQNQAEIDLVTLAATAEPIVSHHEDAVVG
jgi:uncharacterized protein (DUF433 family)